VHKPYNPSYVDVYPDAARSENKEAGRRKQVPLPGYAIQLWGSTGKPMTHGQLLFAASYTIGDDSVFDALNYAFWSDDLGESWHMSGPVSRRQDGSSAKGLNKTMAVELENGNVLVNSPNYQNGKVFGRRAVAAGSFDEVGNIHFQPACHDPLLVDSGVQASLIRYTRSDEEQYGSKSRLPFANPNHPKARINMTVRLSYNEGKTWPVSKVIDPRRLKRFSQSR
jgi:sialidase-1